MKKTTGELVRKMKGKQCLCGRSRVKTGLRKPRCCGSYYLRSADSTSSHGEDAFSLLPQAYQEAQRHSPHSNSTQSGSRGGIFLRCSAGLAIAAAAIAVAVAVAAGRKLEHCSFPLPDCHSSTSSKHGYHTALSSAAAVAVHYC